MTRLPNRHCAGLNPLFLHKQSGHPGQLKGSPALRATLLPPLPCQLLQSACSPHPVLLPGQQQPGTTAQSHASTRHHHRCTLRCRPDICMHQCHAGLKAPSAPSSSGSSCQLLRCWQVLHPCSQALTLGLMGAVACLPPDCLPRSTAPSPCRPGPRSALPTWALCCPRCCAGTQTPLSASPPPCCPSSRALPSRSAWQLGRQDAAADQSPYLLPLYTDRVASQSCSSCHPFALPGAACFQPLLPEPPEQTGTVVTCGERWLARHLC